MLWTKINADYVSDSGYRLTKTLGKRWVVSLGDETLIGGKQFRQLAEAQNAAEADYQRRGDLPLSQERIEKYAELIQTGQFNSGATPPAVIPMPPEPDKSDDGDEGEDTPLMPHPEPNPEPEPSLPGHTPDHGEPNFASDAPAIAQVAFSPLKWQFIHPDDPNAVGSTLERLQDIHATLPVRFRVGGGTRGVRMAG